MNYQTILPSPELAPYVRCFWVLEGEASLEKPYFHRSLANGCVEIVFHYKGRFDELLSNEEIQPAAYSGFQGPIRHFRRYVIQQDFAIFGVYLYPFAIPELFSLSATMLVDQIPDMESLLGYEGACLEQRINGAADTMERLTILSGFLQKRIPPIKKQHVDIADMVRYMIHTRGATHIQSLARDYAISLRHFERKLKPFTGFSPKLFSRIIRFQAALGQYKGTFKNLTELAYACGYYDQSHFIHDFKTFSGHNPKAYFAGKTESTVWKD